MKQDLHLEDSENEILIEFEDETGEKKTITIIVQ